MVDPDIGALIVAGMALLLASASWHKWRALPEFESVLAAYHLVPQAIAGAAARLVPAIEVAIAAALLVGPTRSWAALAGAALLLAYAGGIAINLRRGRRDLDCGCAGPEDRRSIAPWMVVRNVVLAAALGVAAVPWSVRPLGPIDALTIGGGLATLAVLYHAVDRLLGQVMPRGATLRSSQ